MRPLFGAIAAGALPLAVALPAGCAPRSATPPPSPNPAAEHAADTLAMLLNADNGLMMRTWSVAGDAQHIGAALLQRQDGWALPPQRLQALRAGGLRLVRIRAESIEPLLEDLGATSLDVAAWHGQVPEWRELLARPVGQDVVVAGPGAPRRLAAGRLRLEARSWTVANEQGPCVYLELRPAHARQPTNLSRLIGDRSLRGDPFDELAVELFLEPGYACVLTWESPAVEWREKKDGQAPEVVLPPQPAEAAAETPPTPGEYLFGGTGEPPLRTMLVFVPSIPARLFEHYRVVKGS